MSNNLQHTPIQTHRPRDGNRQPAPTADVSRAGALPLWALAVILAGCVTRSHRVSDPAPGPVGTDTPPPRVHTLAAGDVWTLEPPDGGRFDASALLRRPDGTLLTVNDKGLPACRIELRAGGRGFLVPEPGIFPPDRVGALPGAAGLHIDAEGLAQDDQGRVYLATEGPRWILRWDPSGDLLERLPIDWSPVSHRFSTRDGNASFEGIAIGENRIYVANEREEARIVVVDAGTARVVDDFVVTPAGVPEAAVHYSDLCWVEDSLWILCRPQRQVLRVDPATRTVLAAFDYSAVETAHAYFTVIPMGFVEGLSVDATDIWLLVDNNGFPRRSSLRDTRPLLFRCPRPDR